MKKRFTTLMLLIAGFLFLGTSGLLAQAEVWNQTYTWNTAKNYRGVAYNVLNNHLYVAGTEGSYINVPAGTTSEDCKIQILDPANGNVLKTISPSSVMPSNWGYGIRDVEVDMDGGIYAMISTGNQWNPLQLYYWENEDADPVQLWMDPSGNADDFGSSFSVYGSLADEALIIIPSCDNAYVYYFEAVNGDIGAVQTLDLNGLTTVDTPHVLAFGTKITDGFGYNNKALGGPVSFDGSGNIVSTVPSALFTQPLNGDAKLLNVLDKQYLIASDGGDVITIDITDAADDLSDLTTADVISTVTGTTPVDGSGWPGLYGTGQEQAVIASPAGDYAIYSLSGDNYVKALADEAAPMASNARIEGSTVAAAVKNAEYTYIDFNGDAEGTTEFKWYLSDDAAGTNKAEITAAAGNASYTIDAADAGKFISFTVMPVAATGTVSDVLNTIESNMLGPVLTEETAPVASNVVMTGVLEVASLLTATYDFADAGSDIEGTSVYTWLLADDAAGTNAVVVKTGSLEYLVTPDDGGKFVIFKVMPVSATGWPLEGVEVQVVSAAAILFPPMPPSALNPAISGREDVAAVLTGSYTYEDLNGDVEEGTLLKWYRADDAAGTNSTMVAEDINTYTLVVADEGKVIIFEITPISVQTVGLDTGIVVNAATGIIEAEPAEYAPRAFDVELPAEPEVGTLLSGFYTYEDTIVNDAEGVSIYKWYTADDAAGTNPVEITGANKQTFLAGSSELGKHLIFEVTPVAKTGGLLVGLTYQSAATATAVVASTNVFGLERMWRGSKIDAATPWYIDQAVTTQRGMALGDEHMYIAARTSVQIINKADGSYVGELDMTGIEGGIYALSDVAVSDDGQILGVPLVASGDFWVYKWADELSAPEKWLTHTPSKDMRLGDKFTVTGDLSGSAVIYAAMDAGDVLVKWTVTGGIAAPAEEVVLVNITNMSTAPAVAPFSVSPDANLLIDAKGFVPTVIDKDGNILGTVPMVDNYAAYKIQSNSPNVFQYKGRTMAAFFQAMRKEPLGARIVIADITSPPYQLVDSTEYVSNQMAWDGYLGKVAAYADDDYYYAYMLQAKHAVGSYRGQLELPLFSSAITSFEGDKVFVFIDKALTELPLSEAEKWVINAGGLDLVVDTMYTGNEMITFELTTNILEGDAVVVTYDGLGTIASFNGLPLAAFGPEDVENIVGSDLPVAANVIISGEAKPDQVLTGSYEFSDPDGDLEGVSTFQWYESTASDGTGMLKLIGETSLTYTVSNDMAAKFVAFEVTPVSATGGEDYLVGVAAISDFVYIAGVGVEGDEVQNLQAYPNPVSGMLTIDNCGNFDQLEVVEISGRVVLSATTFNENRVELNMGDLSNGVYFLKLSSTSGDSEVLRIIKAN